MASPAGGKGVKPLTEGGRAVLALFVTAAARVFDTPNPRKALAALFFWSNLDSLLFLNS